MHRYATEIFKQRALSMGILCNHFDFQQAVLSIMASVLREESDAVYVGPAEQGAEVWEITLRGERVLAVYNPQWACLVTLRQVRAAIRSIFT